MTIGILTICIYQALATSKAEFCNAVTTWLDEDLGKMVLNAIVLRLDEFGVGMITLLSVDRFVGEKTLKDAISQMQPSELRSLWRDRLCLTFHPAAIPIPPLKALPAPVEPWLVWIDDEPENSSELVSLAQRSGISVFQIFSTASAKAWIDVHEGEPS